MKSLSDLPNTEGFEFQAVLKDGTTTLCKVVLHPEGYHTTSIYRGLPVIEDESTAKKQVDELDKKWPELKHSYEWVPDPTHAAG